MSGTGSWQCPGRSDAVRMPWTGGDLTPVSGARLEQQEPQRRQTESQRLLVAVRRDRFGEDDAAVADVRPAIDGAVAVHNLEVRTGRRHTDAIPAARHRREVDDGDEEVVGTAGPAQERHDAVLAVVAVNPLEAG